MELLLKATTKNQEELDGDDMVLLTKHQASYSKNSSGRKGEFSTQKESFNCFLVLFNEVTNLNLQLDNYIDQFYMPTLMSCHM